MNTKPERESADADKRAACERVANELAQLNPTLRFAFNASCVVHVHGDELGMVASWTCFGQFVSLLDRPLNVTSYVERASLSFAGGAK